MVRFCRIALAFWVVTVLSFVLIGGIVGGLLGRFCPDYFRASVHVTGEEASIDYVQYAVARNVLESCNASTTFVLLVLFFGTLIEIARVWRPSPGGQGV